MMFLIGWFSFGLCCLILVMITVPLISVAAIGSLINMPVASLWYLATGDARLFGWFASIIFDGFLWLVPAFTWYWRLKEKAEDMNSHELEITR